MNRQADASRNTTSVLNLVNQAVFFMVAERWFCPEGRLTGLYSLMFYNVISYIISYARKSLGLQNYSPIVHVSEHTNIRHLALTATKMVLDFTKAVTFVISGVLMLLIFGLEQGLEHFNPTWLYIVTTALYFVLTEQSCQAFAPAVLTWLRIEILENLESLWTPLLICTVTSFMSACMIMLVWLFTKESRVLLMLACYSNVYQGLKDFAHYREELSKERASLSKYRFATKQELLEKDDVCAVCLQLMVCARVTPCKHMFHGDCLRQCLKSKHLCPVCKQDL